MTRSGTILALDLGTSYFKASLFDAAGELCGLHRVPAPVTRTADDCWEMDPGRFRETIRQTISILRDGNAAEIAAITFATQANSFVLLDAGGKCLTPIILWPDMRGREFGPAMEDLADERFSRTSGMPTLSVQCAPAKLMWLGRHRPEVWNRAARFCLISDYLTWWLTGRHITEAGVAALSGMVDIDKLRWCPTMLQRISLPESWLPAIARAGTIVGPLLPAMIEQLGIPRECRFVVGCLDQYAGAIGTGTVEAGAVTETTGTVLATVRCADRQDDHAGPGVFQGPSFLPGRFYQMAFGDISANLLEAYRNQLPDRPDFPALLTLAMQVGPGADGLRLRSHPPGTLAFHGQRDDHTRGHFVRAILEGVATALAEHVRALCHDGLPRKLRAAGGAARSDVWLQIKADTLGVTMEATACDEPTSLGAAILAAAALGWGTVPQLAEQWVDVRRAIAPTTLRVVLK